MTQTNTTEEALAGALHGLVDQIYTGTQEAASSSDETETSTQAVPSTTEYPYAEDYSNIPMNDKIPENSKTITIDSSTSRFSGAVWYKKVQEKIITIAGLGGIGSWLTLLLSRMKPHLIVLYDFDNVEEGNMSGQFYSRGNLGLSKVSAMSLMMHSYSDYHSIIAYMEEFTIHSQASDVMICGFDNMLAREVFFSSWYTHVQGKPEYERKHCLFIDGRLAAEEFQVLCIRGDDSYNMDRYRKDWLFSDSEADTTLCSYKQTTFMANMIGSIIANLFVNFCANDLEGDEKPLMDRDLPFLTTYDASMMMFTTEG